MRTNNDLIIADFAPAFRLLNGRLALAGAPVFHIVVCGGTALVAMGLVSRATRDVDIVALLDPSGGLVDPAPLPEPLLAAAGDVAEDLGLPKDWLNNGPSQGDGGLFRMGLPEGFEGRLTPRSYGSHLSVSFISRVDQIHFKVYAAADQPGSYHVADLHVLAPTDDELLAGARWARSHDPSEGYRSALAHLFEGIGRGHLVALL